jgi:hypothetical protein
MTKTTLYLTLFAIGLSCLACATNRPPHYEAATSRGNQCHNECNMTYRYDDELEELNACFFNCYRYNGGTYTEGPSCILTTPNTISKNPPNDKSRVDDASWTEPAGLTSDEKAPTPLY